MSVRTIILLVVAAAAALAAVVGARNWLTAQQAAMQAAIPAPPPPAPTTEILVARANLPAGLIVQEKHLDWVTWPEDALAPAFISRANGATQQDWLGSVVRSGFVAGEPLTQTRLVKPGERGFLAAVLTPGNRALSVAVNATSGIAGFVFPGDRVDLILTHGIDRDNGRSVRRASETVLSDVRVLAIDQSTNDQSTEPNVAKNVTLELTPKQAEKVTLLQDIGRLSLSLRSLARPELDAEQPETSALEMPEADTTEGEPDSTYTWDSEVSRLLNRKSGPSVRIVRGSEAVIVSF